MPTYRNFGRSTRRPTTAVVAAAVSVALAACGPSDEELARGEEASQEALRLARADSVAAADARFDPAAFDTIAWSSVEERLERGEVVWRFSCKKCHGETGLGDGQLAQVEELDMPVVVEEEWDYAGDIPAIRHRIFVGHESEMPSWGLYGLKYRDIDAVSFYIEHGLRAPEP